MTAAELGLLLLRCPLTNDDRPLTHAQYVKLRRMVQTHPHYRYGKTELDYDVLLSIGCDDFTARNILGLLSRQNAMIAKLREWQRMGVSVLTRISSGYPQVLLERLGDEAPAVLFCKGDRSLIDKPAISLVGSRDISPENARFAKAVGRFAAQNGLVLVSGNARGADSLAQAACRDHGGSVIIYTAEPMSVHFVGRNLLVLSEENPDAAFTPYRALARNRLIHAAGSCTFVAQSGETGGTWDGTVKNLRAHRTPVYLLDDGSAAAKKLCARGAHPIPISADYSAALAAAKEEASK